MAPLINNCNKKQQIKALLEGPQWAVFGSTRLKPWPNGFASRRTLKTWVYLRLRLARPCVHLRWLALTLVEIKFAQVAIFSLFGHPIQVNPSFVTSIRCNSKLKANETWYVFLEKGFFLVYLRGNLRIRLATQSKSLRKFNLRQLATTCESVTGHSTRWIYILLTTLAVLLSHLLCLFKNAIWSTEMNLK